MPRTRRQIYRRRRIAVSALAAVALTVGIYTPAALLAPLPAASASIASAQPATTPAAELTWPSYGGSAIGAVGFDGVLASSGSAAQVPMASLTKVVTALVVLDAKPLAGDEEGPLVTFTAEDEVMRQQIVARRGLVQRAEIGTGLSERDLLEGALVASANNYAAVAARWAFDGNEEFLAAASDWLLDQGLTETTIADAMGLSARSASSPADLVEIGKLALANPVVSHIVAAASVDVAGIGELKNRNLLIGTPGFRGIKTGTLDAAGKCLLWAVDIPVGDEVVSVVGVFLDGPDHRRLAADVNALVSGIRSSFHEVTLTSADQPFATYATEWGSSARAVASATTSVVVWSDTAVTADVRITPKTSGNRGDAAGQATFTVGNNEIAVPLELDRGLESPDGWWKITNPELVFG